MNLHLNPNSPERGQEQAGLGKELDEKSILTSLDRGDAISAEKKAREANLSPDAWRRVENTADDRLKELNPQESYNQPLSNVDAKEIAANAEDSAISNYGKEHVPFMNTISESQKALEDNDNTIKEILRAIKEAKKYARRIKIPLPIYGLIQTKKLKEQLKKLEGLNAKLQNPASISYKLQADKISPDSSDKTFMTSVTLSGAGYGVLAGTALATKIIPGATATTGQVIGVGSGFMAGTFLYLSGIVGLAIGGIQKLINIYSASKTIDALTNLETEMRDLRVKNSEALGQVKSINKAYVQGARGNLEKIMS